MSSMSMFMHGVGNEAFEEEPGPAPLDLTVDSTELAAATEELDESVAAMTAQNDRLVALQDVRSYGESIRDTLSEPAAAELQRRVVEVLGVERGATIVGSVESYNGSLANDLLNGGLESIDGFIRNTISELIRLIRMAFKMFTQYFSSAQMVLSKQLLINDQLRTVIANRNANWAEWSESVGDVNRGIKVSGCPLSGQQLRMLCAITDGGLKMPDNFLSELGTTINTIYNNAVPMVSGLMSHFDSVLDLVARSPKMVDAERLTRLREITLDRHIQVNKLLVRDDGKTGITMISTRPMLGGKILAIEAPTVSTYLRNGNFAHQIAAADCMKKITVGLYSVRNSGNRSATTVRGLSRSDGLTALGMIDNLITNVIGLALGDHVSLLAKRADDLATKVLPGLHTERGVNYISHISEIMSALTKVTTQAPRDIVTYVGGLTESVRGYVAISAGISN